MFYKASDVSTSTRDWFDLSFNTIPWALLRAASEAGEIEEEIGDEPDEPDPYDYDTPDNDATPYEHAKAAYDDAMNEYREREENAGSEPMWSFVFASDDARHCIEEAQAVGLRVMTHEDLGTFFAADSAGHSFFGAYWIPLRARIASRQIDGNEAEENVALLVMLAREYHREGEGGVDPCGAIGALLGVSEPTIEAARKRYAEGT